VLIIMLNFKKPLGLGLFGLTVASVFVPVLSVSAESTNQKVANEKTWVVATSGTLYPTSYHESKGSALTGYDVAVVKAVAKGLNKKVVFKEMDVDGMLTSVNNGSAVMAANDFGISPQRKKQFTLSTPYKFSYDSAMVRKGDDSGITKITQLTGKKAAGEAGTNYQKLASQLGATQVNYDNVSNDVYLQDLANGRTDVILNDHYLQEMALKAMPDMQSKLTIPKKFYFTTQDDKAGTGIIMKKTNTKMAKAVNQEITKLEKNGTITKISKQFYGGQDVSKHPNVKTTYITINDN
jgi:L-cystine transport system substrate-binding protein